MSWHAPPHLAPRRCLNGTILASKHNILYLIYNALLRCKSDAAEVILGASLLMLHSLTEQPLICCLIGERMQWQRNDMYDCRMIILFLIVHA